jgi:hypothetical protein
MKLFTTPIIKREASMAKRGRPKLNRPRVDLGTQELVAKRLMVSPRDPTLSTSPLDSLKARGLISDEAHSAASYFAALRKIVFGKAHPQAVDLTAISGKPVEPDIGRAETFYRDACFAMRAQGRQALDAVENLVVHERWPAWLFVSGAHGTEQKWFGLGLAALLGWYKGKQRRAA